MFESVSVVVQPASSHVFMLFHTRAQPQWPTVNCAYLLQFFKCIKTQFSNVRYSEQAAGVYNLLTNSGYLNVSGCAEWRRAVSVARGCFSQLNFLVTAHQVLGNGRKPLALVKNLRGYEHLFNHKVHVQTLLRKLQNMLRTLKRCGLMRLASSVTMPGAKQFCAMMLIFSSEIQITSSLAASPCHDQHGICSRRSCSIVMSPAAKWSQSFQASRCVWSRALPAVSMFSYHTHVISSCVTGVNKASEKQLFDQKKSLTKFR